MNDDAYNPEQNFLTKHPLTPQKPPRGKRRLFLFALIGIVLLLSGFMIVRSAIDPEGPEDPLAYDPESLEPKKPEGLLKRISHFIFSKDINLAGQRNDRINVLLLGMGGPGHDGPYLTDTIIIASIQPSTGKVAMISIPRDLAVNIPKHGYRKINSANAIGEVEKKDWGAAFAAEVIEDTFGIDIHYYIRVDFKAFEEMIDEVDGVSVNVERSFVDSQYPAANNQYQTVSFKKGVQTLSGEDALMYARSRHGNNGEGSDFARAKRQQKVLLALKEKILSLRTLANPVRIYNITKSLDTHITTNMAFSEIIALVKLSRELDTKELITVVLDTSSNGYLVNGTGTNGAFILSPKSGNFDEINSLIAHVFEHNNQQIVNDTPPQETEELGFDDINVEIQNGTWRAGLAARMRERLRKNKLTVSSIGNTTERPRMASGIYKISDSTDIAVMDLLKDTLDIAIKETPDSVQAASSTDILIILGEDFQE